MIKRRFIDDITDFIFIRDELSPADAIFIPGNWSVELPEMAAELYHQGLARFIVPSGKHSIKLGYFPGPRIKGDVYPPPYTTEAAFFKTIMVQNGVPADCIFPEERATYTFQNAQYTRELLESMEKTVKSAIIVCRYPHARRCLEAYQLVFPQVDFMVYGVESVGLPRPADWYTNEKDLKHVMDELKKCGGQLVGHMLDTLRTLGIIQEHDA
jgi:uncharacterized SAM-binding protein YcdF (DUF218 family)